MEAHSIETYLHAHIPLSAAMEVKVEWVDESSAKLSAPLLPNINHRETVFGGSLSALGILCAWTYLHNRLSEQGLEVRLVIQRNTMEYKEPALGRFCAALEPVSSSDWSRFVGMIERKSKGRIVVKSRLFEVETGAPLGVFEGSFVAIRL